VQASFVYAKDSIRSLAQQLGYFETVASHKYLDTYLDKIAAVTPEAIQRVARKYLTEESRTVGWYEPLPADSALGDAGTGGQAESFASGAQKRNHALDGLSACPPVLGYRDDAAGLDTPSDVVGPAGGGSTSGAISVLRAGSGSPTRRTFPNGLTLLVRENHANPTIALQGVVKAGGIFDPPGKSGLAAFVGSMLDQGTKTRSAFEQATAVESLGASLRYDGGQETLSLAGNLLSGDLEQILRVLADALRNPAFPPEQVEKIRGELVIDYKVAENSTSSVAARRANELLYPVGHPYHWNPGGTDSTLSAITREDLASFHARYYGPNTTTLVLVGDVTASRAAELVEKVFGHWKKLPDPPPFQLSNADPPKEARDLVLQRPGKSQADVVWAVR